MYKTERNTVNSVAPFGQISNSFVNDLKKLTPLCAAVQKVSAYNSYSCGVIFSTDEIENFIPHCL